MVSTIVRSVMELLPVPNSENAPAADKRKGKNFGVGVGNGPARKKLGDITNLQCEPNVSSHNVTLSAKDIIHQLQNENMGLKKALVDKNKLIEASRVELQKLTLCFEKVKLQNVQLAQANSQLLQDLNSGKDRLKALQHELGCRNGLLKALKLKAASQAHHNQAEVDKSVKEEGVPTQLVNKSEDELHVEFNPSDLRRQSIMQSLGVSTKIGARRKAESLDSLPRRRSTRLNNDVSLNRNDVPGTGEPSVPICPAISDLASESTSGALDIPVSKVRAKQKAVNEDAHPRRQSRKFSLVFTQTRDDVCETENIQTPTCIATSETACGSDSNVSVPALIEENKQVGLTTRSPVSHRQSSGRPSRHAATRIQSYKEVAINIKMRRND